MNRLIWILLLLSLVVCISLLSGYYLYSSNEIPKIINTEMGEKNEFDMSNSFSDTFYTIEYKNEIISVRNSAFSNNVDSRIFFDTVLDSNEKNISFMEEYQISGYSGLIIEDKNNCTSCILRQGSLVLIFSCIEDEIKLKKVIEWFIENEKF